MDWLKELVPALDPSVGYWVTFGVMFAESLAFVGILVPGTLFLVSVGSLACAGILEFWPVVGFAVGGAILGDGVSYWLGRTGKKLFRAENRIFRQSHLALGEGFFRRHGGKSVFIGRFLGPLRPIVPFVAGVMRMRQGPFWCWNVLSGISWALSYVLLGYAVAEGWKLARLRELPLPLLCTMLAGSLALFLAGGWLKAGRSRPPVLKMSASRRSMSAALAIAAVPALVFTASLAWEFLGAGPEARASFATAPDSYADGRGHPAGRWPPMLARALGRWKAMNSEGRDL